MLAESKWEDERAKGLAELFHRRSLLQSSSLAIEDGEDFITYRDLHTKALALAWKIHTQHPADISPIGIIIPRSINHILSQVAIIYSGRACVPLDDELPDSYLQTVLKSIGSSIIITDTTQQHRLPSCHHIVLDHHSLFDLPDTSFQPIENGPQACCHILHTSGTTGKAKAVEARAEGLINICLDPIGLVRKGQRLCHASRPIFDLSVLDIWATLLNGGTIVIIGQETLLDPVSLSDFLRIKRIDVLPLTTSLLTVMAYSCPGAFSTLNTLITGGEAINCQTIESIFREGAPSRIINGYGPTECSVFSLLHVVSQDEATRGEIPLGKPPWNVETFIVDEKLNLVKPGQVGELLVSGVGVAGGYIDDQPSTDKSFLHLPRLPRTIKGGTGKVYRTGDLVQADPEGTHYFIGRRDNQVKIRGQRVELEALEAILLRTGLVNAAVVIVIAPKGVDKGQFLLAFCIPTSSNVTSAAISRSYIEEAPHLVLPRVEIIDKLPLRTTGKVDRKLLEEQYFQRITLSRTKAIRSHNDTSAITAEIEYIWTDVFGLTSDRVSRTDGFLAMGGTSLMAAMMIARINRTFGTSVQVRALYENTTIEKLESLVANVQGEGEYLKSQADEEIWWQDSQLGQHLRPMVAKVTPCQHCSEGRVFLTGATGFVGIFLLATLLQRPNVKKVACLVRAENKTSAERRLQNTLAKYSLLADLSKAIALPGDFSQPNLGLTAYQYDYYAEWASVVFHLGAKVSYVAPYSSHREENVVGTLRMLEFVNHKRLKALHYTSTIAAYGPTGYITGTKVVPEDERPAPHLAALSYDTGYSQSKYVAEAIMWNAIDNGFPIAIYRSGFVLGHSKTGVCNRNDFVSRLYTSCMEMGVYPFLPDQRKEFVAVDFVVNAMVHIASSHSNLGHAYNLVQPDITNALDVNTCFEVLNRISPQKMRGIPYKDWVNSLSTRSDSRLQPLIPCFKEPVLGDKTRWEVYEKMTEYGRENLRYALRDAPEIIKCDTLEVLFLKLLPSWLPSSAQASSSDKKC
ncbi:non-ribosomal peptide synthetase [Aspergillus steynii IBT 23096]|uniref:Non-ribosomal peptide synthetase n=1 Tax=Aspergillus steynii IBT 23096 TaxID=1392250 RepID=A0A2I2GLT9_9EURO|nr:non-ribosomal peptide synthetase [Aspergillus steynii IBT 23096]PLB53851.1 non-ribosomal peptide synthetase [Aspergillus steynii IBT 23096]